jgi:hypothetical protein
LLLAQGCDREPSAWAGAEASGQPADYQAYLRDHPEGEHAAMARERLDDLAWASAADLGDRESLVTYLEALPDGRHGEQARAQLEALDWTSARAAHDAASYQSFAEAYPASERAEDARRLASLVGLRGDWVFGGYAFRIAPSPDGGVAVDPVAVEASPDDTHSILEREVSNVEADGETLKLHHTVTTESRTSLGVVINNQELMSVSQDQFRSEYDLRLATPNRLTGTNHEGYLGVGSTGFFDWDALLLRAVDPDTPTDGLSGLWVAGANSPTVVRIAVGADGGAALSSSPVAPRMQQGSAAEASYALETADGATLSFTERLVGSGGETSTAYACQSVGAHELTCTVRVSCSSCTATTSSTIAARRLAASD